MRILNSIFDSLKNPILSNIDTIISGLAYATYEIVDKSTDQLNKVAKIVFPNSGNHVDEFEDWFDNKTLNILDRMSKGMSTAIKDEIKEFDLEEFIKQDEFLFNDDSKAIIALPIEITENDYLN